MHPVSTPQSPGTAKAYNRLKLSLGLLSSILAFLLPVALIVEGWSTPLAAWARSILPGTHGALVVFLLAVAALQAAITLPFAFVLGYVVEHRYGLSNQSLTRWALERLKGVLVSAPLAGAIAITLFLCMEWFGDSWWAVLGVILTLANILLARVAPVLLLPIFYRVVPLEEGHLKTRITSLCTSTGFRYEGIYSFDLSKNTRKANAAFTGIGKSKRILLGDTLLKGFSDEEIETVVAHELGHFFHRHILIGILTGAVATFAGLFVAARLYSWSLARAGFAGLTDLPALPLLAVWISLFALVTMPLGNMLSRKHERDADVFAVRTTGNAAGFASALRKLAAQNLADPDPHPLIEFLLYSHPSIHRRLRMVEGALAP